MDINSDGVIITVEKYYNGGISITGINGNLPFGLSTIHDILEDIENDEDGLIPELNNQQIFVGKYRYRLDEGDPTVGLWPFWYCDDRYFICSIEDIPF